MKKKSIKDIAQDLGVSKTTVSFVLNKRGDEKNISKKTQKRILDYVKEVNYHPNQIAKSLKNGTTQTIGYLVPDISNPFYAKIGRIIEDLLWGMGYHLIIGSTDENKDKEDLLLNMFVNRQVDGLIIASCFLQSDALISLSKQNFPMVFFDREDPEFLASYILVENKRNMQAAVQKTIDKGAKKVGLLSITPDVYSLKLRIEGYKQALLLNNLDLNKNFIRIVDINSFKESAEKELQILIDLGVDVIAFTNNQITATAIWLMNIHYPHLVNKITFVSFDNLDLFDYSLPKVVSVAQPIDKIAKQSVDILEAIIRTKEDPKLRLELEPKIIER